MIIEKVIAHKNNIHRFENYERDEVSLEWYELNKKVMRKTTCKGSDIGFRLPHGSESLKDADIIAMENGRVIVVRVKSCQCIEIHWHDTFELAKLCYEIGNRHSPLFLSESGDSSFLIPFDSPMLELLHKMNFYTKVRDGFLVNPLSANISAHSH